MFSIFLRESELGLQLKKCGVFTFDDALHYINNLPYGRNTNSKIISILEDEKGTCSTKHAFLALLAQENNLPVKLMLGYYKMNQRNTPQIGNTLNDYNLPFILEGHCYLKYHDQILDATFPGELKNKLDFDILDEQEISPLDLHNKPFNHKKKLKQWLRSNPNYPILDIELLWKVRERCIQVASQVALP